MKPRFEPVSPEHRIPGWLIFTYLAWAAITLAVHLVNKLSGHEFIICTLRRFTGIPCPTCGATRAVDAAFSGDLLAAFAFNPLVMLVLLIGIPIVVIRFVAKRRVVLGLTRRERIIAWVTGLSLVALNWSYVIYYHFER